MTILQDILSIARDEVAAKRESDLAEKTLELQTQLRLAEFDSRSNTREPFDVTDIPVDALGISADTERNLIVFGGLAIAGLAFALASK